MNATNCITGDYVSTIDVKGKKILQVEPEALTLLSEHAFTDIAHLLRPGHLQVVCYTLQHFNNSDEVSFVFSIKTVCIVTSFCTQ